MSFQTSNILYRVLHLLAIVAFAFVAWSLASPETVLSNLPGFVKYTLVIVLTLALIALALHTSEREEDNNLDKLQNILEETGQTSKEIQRAIIRLRSNLDDSNVPLIAAMTNLLQGIQIQLEELEQNNDALSITAEEATEKADSLEKEYSSLEVAPHQRSEFLSRMGDEITSPMNSLRTMLRLINKSNLDSETHDLLKIAMHSAHSLIENITNILEFSKLDAGLLQLKPEPFDIQETISHVLETQESIALSKSLLIEKHINPDVPYRITAPRKAIIKVLDNLISNAIRFTDKGSIDVKVDIYDEHGRHFIRFTIVDTGIGIPEAAQSELFDSLDTDTELKNSSFTGRLRLIVCKQLCELMGGHIGVSSEEGKGSQFWFTSEYKL